MMWCRRLDDELDEAAASMTRSQRRRRTRDVCRPLRHWLYGHRDTPYPSRSDKLQLAAVTQLSLTQVSLTCTNCDLTWLDSTHDILTFGHTHGSWLLLSRWVSSSVSRCTPHFSNLFWVCLVLCWSLEPAKLASVFCHSKHVRSRQSLLYSSISLACPYLVNSRLTYNACRGLFSCSYSLHKMCNFKWICAVVKPNLYCKVCKMFILRQ